MKFVQDTEEEVPPLKIGSKMCVVEGECFGCRLTNRSVMIFEPGERLILPRRNPDIILNSALIVVELFIVNILGTNIDRISYLDCCLIA